MLINIAFKELGANKVFDDFPKSRIAAEEVFKKIGFKRVTEDIVELTKLHRLLMKQLHSVMKKLNFLCLIY